MILLIKVSSCFYKIHTASLPPRTKKVNARQFNKILPTSKRFTINSPNVQLTGELKILARILIRPVDKLFRLQNHEKRFTQKAKTL